MVKIILSVNFMEVFLFMDTNKEKIITDKQKAARPSVYRCTSCGVTVQSNGTPKVCPKCDNEKFYLVK